MGVLTFLYKIALHFESVNVSNVSGLHEGNN